MLGRQRVTDDDVATKPVRVLKMMPSGLHKTLRSTILRGAKVGCFANKSRRKPLAMPTGSTEILQARVFLFLLSNSKFERIQNEKFKNDRIAQDMGRLYCHFRCSKPENLLSVALMKPRSSGFFRGGIVSYFACLLIQHRL